MTYHMNGKLVGIGTAEGGDGASAETEAFLTDTDWDKFASDKAYREERIKEGAELAAAGGCAAMGAPQAAPLCAYVGGEVAGYAIKLWNSVFGNDDAAKAAKARADAAKHMDAQQQANELGIAIFVYLQTSLVTLSKFRHELDGGYLSGPETFKYEAGGMYAGPKTIDMLINAMSPCAALRGTAKKPSQLYDELELVAEGGASKYVYCQFRHHKGQGQVADMWSFYEERFYYYYNLQKFAKSAAVDKALADTQKMARYIMGIIGRRVGELMLQYTLDAASKEARKEAFAAAGGKAGKLKDDGPSAATKVVFAAGVIAAVATAGVIASKKGKLRRNPSQQTWLLGGAALAGVAGGAYLLLRKGEGASGGDQLGPPPQADVPAYTTPGAPATFPPPPPVLVGNYTITKAPRCFSLSDMWEFSKTLPNYNLIYAAVPMSQWGVPKDAARDVRYSPDTCKFYMWSGGKWAENATIQAKANP